MLSQVGQVGGAHPAPIAHSRGSAGPCRALLSRGNMSSLVSASLPGPPIHSANSSSNLGTRPQFPRISSTSSLHCFGKGRCVWSLGGSHCFDSSCTTRQWVGSSALMTVFHLPFPCVGLLAVHVAQFLVWEGLVTTSPTAMAF